MRREEGKSGGRKGGNEGKRGGKNQFLLEIGGFFSLTFLMWEFRELHSITPKVSFHS